MMNGPGILVNSITDHRYEDQFGNLWQYNPWSDHHSKVACWGVLFDLLQHCPRLQAHAAAGKVGFGINHRMVDFATDRHKDLDLVLCLPRDASAELPNPPTFGSLAERYGVCLTESQATRLGHLPTIVERPAGDVLVALEAKACMTEHSKASPRFFDELSSGWQCINGSAQRAIAVGFAMVNAAESYLSPKRNQFQFRERAPEATRHRQPKAVLKAQETARKVRTRDHVTDRGYDAMGIVTISGSNDLTPFELAPTPPALAPGDAYEYEMMIRRIAGIYDARFAEL